MKFGIHNPSWQFGLDPYNAFDGVKAKAQWAENAGYTWFSVMDHLIQIPLVGAPEEPFMESWTVLAGLAAVTSKIHLATLVSSVHYRNPAHLAKIAATVDIISRGRMILGIGAGWFDEEYRQYGWDFPEKPATRIRQMEEAVRLIQTMWTEPRATFHGKWFHIQDAILEPKPARKPPIMIAGGGEQMTLRVVARLGDLCNLFGSPDEVKHKYDILRAHCETEGRDYNTIQKTALTGVLLAKDETALAEKRQNLGATDPFRGIAATVDRFKAIAGRYRDVGTDLLIVSAFRNDQETLQLIASDVIPSYA